jgi:hypothetical protein
MSQESLVSKLERILRETPSYLTYITLEKRFAEELIEALRPPKMKRKKSNERK